MLNCLSNICSSRPQTNKFIHTHMYYLTSLCGVRDLGIGSNDQGYKDCFLAAFFELFSTCCAAQIMLSSICAAATLNAPLGGFIGPKVGTLGVFAFFLALLLTFFWHPKLTAQREPPWGPRFGVCGYIQPPPPNPEPPEPLVQHPQIPSSALCIGVVACLPLSLWGLAKPGQGFAHPLFCVKGHGVIIYCFAILQDFSPKVSILQTHLRFEYN